MNLNGIHEKDLMFRVNTTSLQYKIDDYVPQFDQLGRYLLYDGLEFTLRTKPSLLTPFYRLSVFYIMYHYYPAAVLANFSGWLAAPFLGASTLGSLSVISGFATYRSNRRCIVRMYLLQNKVVARLLTADGSSFDVPVSSIEESFYHEAQGNLGLKIENRTYYVFVKKATRTDLSLLFGITRPGVHSVEITGLRGE